MTQEEKQLLLKDLCARLPYALKVNIHVIGSSYDEDHDLKPEIAVSLLSNDDMCIKPYLRPMSSMTEEEKKEWRGVIDLELKALEGEGGHTVANAASSAFEIDFYNSHHFDYRGLIEKGLALEAKEGMYKTE